MSIRLIAVILGLFALLGGNSALAELKGVYNGVDASQGMQLSFSGSGKGISGVLKEPSGASNSFNASVFAQGAETKMKFGGRDVYVVFTEEPLGVSMVIVPLGSRGEVLPGEADAMIFLKDGVVAPPRPARYIEPPAGPGGTIDPRAFIESYSFWPSTNVAYGYGMVRGRYRTLIRLHPVVQTDILWKLCRSGASSALRADALRGQGVTCNEVLATFGRMLTPGGSVKDFNRFRAEVETQKAQLVEAIICSIDYRRNDPECKEAGARVAQAAVSLETVKSVLARY